MNKSELIAEVAHSMGESQAKTEKFINIFTETVRTQLAQGEIVQIADFGKWEVVEHAARKGRHPKTGEQMEIAARKAVKFRTGRLVREQVEVTV